VVELGGTTGTVGENPTSPERATDETWSVALSGLGRAFGSVPVVSPPANIWRPSGTETIPEFVQSQMLSSSRCFRDDPFAEVAQTQTVCATVFTTSVSLQSCSATSILGKDDPKSGQITASLYRQLHLKSRHTRI
jgi:hypothetical protein